MKQMLSVEQSAELIKRGVSADKASEKERIYKPIVDQNGIAHNIYVSDAPIFTLADLLSLLPKHIPFANAEWYLNIQWEISWGKWLVQYLDFDHDDEVVKEEEAPELIDALYLLTLAVINHVKLD